MRRAPNNFTLAGLISLTGVISGCGDFTRTDYAGQQIGDYWVRVEENYVHRDDGMRIIRISDDEGNKIKATDYHPLSTPDEVSIDRLEINAHPDHMFHSMDATEINSLAYRVIN